MAVELENCPFCGADNPRAYDAIDGSSISCRACGAGIMSYSPGAVERVRELWNRRTPTSTQDTAGLVEALREMLEIAELFVPVPLQAPGFKRARAALAKAGVK